jgi:hypothetical protein
VQNTHGDTIQVKGVEMQPGGSLLKQALAQGDALRNACLLQRVLVILRWLVSQFSRQVFSYGFKINTA